MSLFSSSEKPPEQIIAEEEDDLAAEVWNLIETEETDLNKLEKLEKEKPSDKDVTRAERALESLAIGIEKDLEKIEEDVGSVQQDEKSYDLDSNFQSAAEHNLKLLELAVKRLVEDDNNLEKWLKQIRTEEDPDDKLSEMVEVEERLKNDLEHIEQLMKNGASKKEKGWIDLQQFNP